VHRQETIDTSMPLPDGGLCTKHIKTLYIALAVTTGQLIIIHTRYNLSN